MWPGDVNDVMHRERARRIGGFEKSHDWVLASEENGWLSELTEIRPVICGGVPRVVVVVVVVGGKIGKSA